MIRLSYNSFSQSLPFSIVVLRRTLHQFLLVVLIDCLPVLSSCGHVSLACWCAIQIAFLLCSLTQQLSRSPFKTILWSLSDRCSSPMSCCSFVVKGGKAVLSDRSKARSFSRRRPHSAVVACSRKSLVAAVSPQDCLVTQIDRLIKRCEGFQVNLGLRLHVVIRFHLSYCPRLTVLCCCLSGYYS